MINDYKFNWKDIEIIFHQGILNIGNASFQRVLDCNQGIPRTISLKGCDNSFPECPGENDFDFSLAGFPLPGDDVPVSWKLEKVCAETFRHGSGPTDDGVRIELDLRERVRNIEVKRTYYIYPKLSALAVDCVLCSPVVPCMYWAERNRQDFNRNGLHQNVMDSLCLGESCGIASAVEFQGRTDFHNQPVIEKHPESSSFSAGLVFMKGAGGWLGCLQEAPPSTERRDIENYDFSFDEKGKLCSHCWGITPYEVTPDRKLYSYRHVIFVAKSKENIRTTLQKYLAVRSGGNIDRDARIVVNPWGGGDFYSKVNETFLLKEIEASREIGAEVYQIDDGYQDGGILRNITIDNIKPDKSFWKLSSSRLPGGFAPLADQARVADLELALWFVPSFNCEFADWRESADMLLEYYRHYNIRMFKFDGVRLLSKTTEDNFQKILRYLAEQSRGQISINFDVTNGQRGGYHMFTEYGTVFLENRYVCCNCDLPKTYDPETTLRNVWSLSQYVRLQSLQVEVPSPEQIDYAYYLEKELSLPDRYPVDYWLGIAMFANPLIWLAPSELSPKMKEKFLHLLTLCKKLRERVFAGCIYPIGNTPDGRSICGFLSWDDSAQTGLMIVYRELNAPENALLELPECVSREVAFGNIHVTHPAECYASPGMINCRMSEPGSWALFELTMNITNQKTCKRSNRIEQEDELYTEV